MKRTGVRSLMMGFGCLLAAAGWAQPACERYELLAPKRGSQIADRQPELHWGGDVGASYRLQVAVILPEGRVLESIDSVVAGTRWRLGRPVPVSTAAVKVMVSRNCPSLTVQDLNAQGPYFLIQAGEQCALQPLSLRQQSGVLHWTASSSYDRFLVQIFAVTQADDGSATTRRISGYEVAAPTWTLTDDIRARLERGAATRESWVASVQALCGMLSSQPQAIALKPVP